MLYKFTLLTLLLCISIHSNIAEGSRRSLVTAIPSDTDDGAVDAIDNDTLDDTDDTDLDATETEGDDGETDTDMDDGEDDEGDDIVGFETTDDSNDIDNTETTEDDSLDSMETTDNDSDDDNNNSDDDSDDASDDGDDNTEDSIDDDNADTSDDEDMDDDDDDDEEDDEDECIGLTQTDCNSLEDDDGDRECAYNQVSGDCYGIERREGQYGSGTFDDGYNTAKAQATQDTANLEAIVGIFAGIVVVLVCIISGGAWYFYTRHGDGHKKIDFEGDDSNIPSCAYGTDDDEKVNVDIIETGNTVGDPMLF